jgi:alkanesulfonate monooxygenase SsuD/methylene tetrahydromethanopterin reductase-like flavin-dependent oxidoreductase (luciferase family)
VFVGGTDRAALRAAVEQFRDQVEAAGRQRSDVLVYALVSVIVDETERAARRKLEEYESYVSPEGALALLSGWSGKDYARPLAAQSSTDAIHAAARVAPRDVQATARRTALSGASPLVVGSPSHVADELESWMDETGIDGFNLTRQVMPETFVDFVDMVVPELQRRGALQREYAPGTLREKLSGGPPRLRPPHPAAGFRRGAPPTTSALGWSDDR